MQPNSLAARLIVVAAGLIGAGGIMAAAGAAHGGGGNLQPIAMVCLAHGPALLALGLAARGRLFALAGLLLVLGTAVFSADLLSRQANGSALVPMLAPVGGLLMIAGWITIIVAALLSSAGESAKIR